jgi:hypothetical protein
LQNFSMTGAVCQPHTLPHHRKLPKHSAMSMLSSSGHLMLTEHLASLPRAIASLQDDFSGQQGHMGWQYGYANSLDGTFRQLQYTNGEHGHAWRCSNTSLTPFVQSQQLHPCASPGACCQSDKAVAVLRYKVHTYASSALFRLAFAINPSCGDGFTLQIRLLRPAGVINGTLGKILYERVVKPDLASAARSENLSAVLRFPLEPDAAIDVMVDPHDNHDCDGVYLTEASIWPVQSDDDSKQLKL